MSDHNLWERLDRIADSFERIAKVLEDMAEMNKVHITCATDTEVRTEIHGNTMKVKARKK